MLVAVVAPAGDGKSTLVAQWAERDPQRFSWVRLTDQHNDPVVLAPVLAQALGAASDTVAAVAQPGRSVPEIASLVLSDVAWPDRPVLVLDDIHKVGSQPSVELLAALVQGLCETQDVVVCSREALHGLPIARMRGEGRVLEIGEAELAMSDDEAAELVSNAGGSLSRAEVVAMNHDVEGWPVALYLATLGHAAGPGVKRDAQYHFGEEGFLAEYVEAEVLSRLPHADLQMLRCLSLFDRVSTAFCQALLDDPTAGDRFHALATGSPLIVPVAGDTTDDEQWYRLHNVLRGVVSKQFHQFEAEQAPMLHGRATEWFEAHSMPEEAIQQAMALGDGPRVARLAGKWGITYGLRGRTDVARGWFDWIDEHGLLETSARAAVVGAWLHLLAGRAAAAERWTTAAERAAARAADAADGPAEASVGVLEAAQCRSGVARMRLDAQLAFSSLSLSSPWRAAALLLVGTADLLTDRIDTADLVLQDAVEVDIDAGASIVGSIALAERAVIALNRGEIRAGASLAERASAFLFDEGLEQSGAIAFVHAVTARARLLRGNNDGAQTALGRAQSLRPYLTYAVPFLAVQTRVEMARCYIALTDVAGAQTVLREARDVFARRPHLGNLPDQVEELSSRLAALKATMAGASSLTAAELRLLPLLATHLSFEEIGARLFVSRNTVKTEAVSIYRKLGASSRAEAVELAQSLGLLTPEALASAFTLPGG